MWLWISLVKSPRSLKEKWKGFFQDTFFTKRLRLPRLAREKLLSSTSFETLIYPWVWSVCLYRGVSIHVVVPKAICGPLVLLENSWLPSAHSLHSIKCTVGGRQREPCASCRARSFWSLELVVELEKVCEIPDAIACSSSSPFPQHWLVCFTRRGLEWSSLGGMSKSCSSSNFSWTANRPAAV